MVDVNSARQANGITNLIVQINGYFNDRPTQTNGDSGGGDHIQYLGDWGQAATNSGYVGLVMVNGGVTNYGWAHFTWSDSDTAYGTPDPAYYAITLIDGAYQTVPNTGILAADGTPGVPIISSINSSSPSPTNYAGASIQLGAD